MTSVVPSPNPLPQLAAPGERLGWIFNDRHLYRRRYMEPPPQPGTVPPELQERLARAQSGTAKRILISLGAGVGLAVLVSCCGGLAQVGDNGASGAGVFVGFIAVVVFLGGVGGAVLAGLAPSMAKRAIDNAQQQSQQEYAQAYAAWDLRR